ncbi:MAG: calcium-binding protein, partial [Microvirga sp.]
GGAGNDHLVGNTNFNNIDGAGGADTMEGGAGSDVFLVDNAADLVVEAAGGGMDAVQATVSYALAASAEVEVMTALGSAGLSLTGSDSANTLHGNAGANTLTGQGGNDVLDGGLGADRLNGGLGNDIVHGGAGKDQLWGGAGRDTFVFDTKPNKRTDLDKVSDFSVRDDAIWLDNGVMPKLGRRGSEDRPVKLNKAFFALDTAKDGNDHVIYKKSTGALYYDPDGTGAKAAIQLATLSKNLKIQATDFFVV